VLIRGHRTRATYLPAMRKTDIFEPKSTADSFDRLGGGRRYFLDGRSQACLRVRGGLAGGTVSFKSGIVWL